MAVANNKTHCFTCNKEKITYPCRGCSKEFCLTHLTEHQQMLNEELNHIINDYDEFKQRINEQKQNPQNHSLIKQIDQWERRSIELIQQKAQDCRENLVKSSQTYVNNIEKKFNDLCEQIKQIHAENEFNEINLNDLRNQLNEITEELNNSSNISIKQESQSFINEISIISSKIILITIISITTWFIFIKKNETPVNTTTATIDASTTGTTIRTTSTTKTTMRTTSSTEIAMLTTAITKTTMFTTLTTETTPTTKTAITTMSIVDTTMLTTSTNFHTTAKNVSKFSKWKQNAIIVAGGNGGGQKLNQLNYPIGIFIDEKKNIFIPDRDNHRIVEWKYNAKEGQIIAGGNKEGNQMDQLNNPTDVIFDQQKHSIIIADHGNRRVIQWFNQNQQILIENISCYGLAMDKHGFLYVSDWNKNEVRRWKMGEYNNEGIVVAGGNGTGSQVNQLDYPSFIFVDEDQSIYVSDTNNNRVMKWRKGAKEGKIVAGGNGYGRNLNQLSEPAGVIVDDLGQIYVTDYGNQRVMRWYEGKKEGEIIVGGNGDGNQSNQLNNPMGLSFDNKGNLYVADHYNHRIAKFEIIL
ncbi:unnamed protein product [Adineta steineri]|uniref:Uncharacterized protein n=2 Tax=Adineta steineri TaxID=433720 RepID=A0A815BZW0_9BILA|nr:unnamed protein product [Adineta steineri]